MEKKKTETAKVRQKQKEQLQWGDMSKIAKIAGVGQSTVERWFKGTTDSPSVKEAVLKLLEARKKSIDSRLNDLT